MFLFFVGKYGIWSVFLAWENMDSGLCFLRGKVWILVCVSCVEKCGFWPAFLAWESMVPLPVKVWTLHVFLVLTCESMDSGLCFFCVKIEILGCASCVGKYGSWPVFPLLRYVSIPGLCFLYVKVRFLDCVSRRWYIVLVLCFLY